MVLKVFVSFCEEDKPLVSFLQGAMKPHANISLYRYDHDLRPGIALADKVKTEIEKADVVLVLLTQNASRSQWIPQEIGVAKALGKLIVPMCEPGVSIPGLLQGIEFLELNSADPLTAMSRAAMVLRDRLDEKERKQLGLALGLLFVLIIGRN